MSETTEHERLVTGSSQEFRLRAADLCGVVIAAAVPVALLILLDPSAAIAAA